MMDEFTDAALVQKYQEFHRLVAKREAELEKELKPYKDGMEVIKNAFLQRFQERGSTNSKTEFGTPYLSTIMNVKVIDRKAFMDFCLANWDELGAEMMGVSAVKDPVKQYKEENNDQDPPGIETSSMQRINMPKG